MCVNVHLSVTSHINCIVARCLINVVYLTACCLYQVMMTVHFLNDIANDAESTQKSKITSYSLVVKLIDRIPGSCLLISSLPGSASRTHVESLGKPRDVIKRFSKPCLVNLISKDTNLIFFMYCLDRHNRTEHSD